MYKTVSPPTFNTKDSQDIQDFLDNNGFVVIKDILSSTEKKQFFELFKNDTKTVSA